MPIVHGYRIVIGRFFCTPAHFMGKLAQETHTHMQKESRKTSAAETKWSTLVVRTQKRELERKRLETTHKMMKIQLHTDSPQKKTHQKLLSFDRAYTIKTRNDSRFSIIIVREN